MKKDKLNFNVVTPPKVKATRTRHIAKNAVAGFINFTDGKYVLEAHTGETYHINNNDIFTCVNDDIVTLYSHVNNSYYTSVHKSKISCMTLKNKDIKYKDAIRDSWALYYVGQRVLSARIQEDGGVVVIKTGVRDKK